MSREAAGLLLVLSGPSGVGKSTLISGLRANVPELRFSVSATTRAPRPGERDGVDYHFLTRDDCRARIAAGEFLEHAEVYGNHYGTLAAPVRTDLAAGHVVLLDIDCQGSAQVRETAPDAVHVFVLPPDLATLESRLRSRGTESDAVVARRMAEASQQIGAAGGYDYLVVNDSLSAAVDTLTSIVRAERARTVRHADWLARWGLRSF